MDDDNNHQNESNDSLDKNEDYNITIVVVYNISPNLSEEHIKEIFSNYGNIKDVYIAIDDEIKVKKDYAFIEFENKKDAEDAELYMNGGQIDGIVVKVEILDQKNCIGIQKKNK